MKIIRSKGLFAMIGEEEKPQVFIDKSDEYRKCLEEIREIAVKRNYLNLDEALDDILDKINEVLK